MTTLQEQFEKDFPDKEEVWIEVKDKYEDSNFTNYDLDLRRYERLWYLALCINKLTSVDLSGCKGLGIIFLSCDNLTSVDFLNDLPNPEKLQSFTFPNNKIQLTDISIFSRFVNLMQLRLSINKLTSVDLSGCKELQTLELSYNNLTSVDFLNDLPNPEKLKELNISNNKIQLTDISIFSRFVNLEILKLGRSYLGFGSPPEYGNQFYGSFKSWKNLTKLTNICIEATDVNEGLEYLPESLARSTAELIAEEKEEGGRRREGEEGGYILIECSPHRTNAKCKAIQDQLRPFNYDLEAWQLAYPEKMLIARPELFTNPDSKDKWLKALTDKITNAQKKLQEIKENEADKTKKIARLESKIQELEQVKATISQQTQTEFSTQDKGTQTDLTMEQIKQWEQTEKKKTLYQKYIEKYGKK